MSLLDLKSLVSKEDFADAHEPLNDGIKEVPNAKTVAASVGTGDVGKDTTSQGPAKVVPEKPDTDEATKTEHNVVKESAEKKGAAPAATPAAKPFPPKKEETDKPAGDKAPPFTPKGETEEKVEDDTAETELEHTSEKAAKDDLEKTEKAKEALEAYAPKARRFDIIGHPTRQAEQIGKAIGFVQRRSGVKTEVTVSAESIDGAIALSQARRAKLGREVRILSQRKVSAEDISDSMGIDNPPLVQEIAVTEAPTEHGAPPMDPAAAAALTEAELDPLDVPVLEIQRVQETLGVLEAGQAAIEQYRQIIRDNPRMSKQAAAVLHAGLEHIDQACGLKMRSTGFESYLTTPRAAMEEADDVGEKTLGSRAAEIGAKILQWIKKLMDHALGAWNKYQTGVATAINKVTELNAKLATVKDPDAIDQVTLNSPSEYLFIDADFIGTAPPAAEGFANEKIKAFYAHMTERGIGRITKALRSGKDMTAIERGIDAAIDSAKVGSIWTDGVTYLPGNKVVSVEGDRLVVGSATGGAAIPDSIDVKVNLNALKISFKRLESLLNVLNDSDVISKLQNASNDMVSEFVKMRKRLGQEVNEEEFQKLQSTTIEWLNKSFDIKVYFEVMTTLAKGASAKIHLGETIFSAFNK